MTTANGLNLTQQGVTYFDGVSIFTGLDGSTSGKVLTSNGTGIAPSFQTPSGGVTSVTATNAGSTVAFTPTAGVYNLSVSNATNLFIGASSGNGTSTGTLNAMVGVNTAPSITSGTSNTVLGAAALFSVLSGSTNCAIGHVALSNLTTGGTNVAVGDSSLGATVSGSGNVGIGYRAGFAILGDNNIAIGQSAMSNGAVSGTFNIGIGVNALLDLTSGANNVAIGTAAGNTNSSGGNNTYIGHGAGVSISSGSNNVFLGQSAGDAYTAAESNNIIIGSNELGTAGESNTIRIGSTATQNFQGGINGVTVTGTAVICSTAGQLGTVVSSARYKDNIEDMPSETSVLDLRPVKFNYKSDEEKVIQYGLIAEEVNETFPYLCFYDAQGRPESVKYHELPVFLLKEIQKLNERIKILEK